jgi:hypothetical protein
MVPKRVLHFRVIIRRVSGKSSASHPTIQLELAQRHQGKAYLGFNDITLHAIYFDDSASMALRWLGPDGLRNRVTKAAC